MKPFSIEGQYDKLDVSAMRDRPGVIDAVDEVLVALAKEERHYPTENSLCCSVSMVLGMAEQSLLQAMRDQHTLDNRASGVLRSQLATTAAHCIRCLMTMEKA